MDPGLGEALPGMSTARNAGMIAAPKPAWAQARNIEVDRAA